MTRYLLRRLLATVPALLLVSVISFGLIRLAPGDVVDALYPSDFATTPEIREGLVRQYGLDRPLPVQYLAWLGQVVQGNLGVSLRHNRPVLALVLETFPATLLLAAGSIALGLAIALPAGILAATRRDGPLDVAISTLALAGISVPSFSLGTVLLLVFAVHLRWLPAIGSPVLPIVTLGLAAAGILSRTVRGGILDELDRDYVRTARARGLTERAILLKHVLKNGLFSTVTIFGVLLGVQLSGAIVVEQVFAWQGLGWLVLQAIGFRDYALVQGVVLFIAASFVGVTLLVDVLYAALDPRVRLQT